MNSRLTTLLQDIKSRSWRAVAVATLVIISILCVIPEAQGVSPTLTESLSLGAFLFAAWIISSDTNRTMRSAKGAVYGTVVFSVLWLTVFVETLQRVARKIAEPGEWWPLGIVTVFFVLFLIAGFMTGNIGSKRTHVKGMPNKDLFR